MNNYTTQQNMDTALDDYNAESFMIQQLINRIATTALVQVRAVRAGGVGAVGFVDVQPLVSQIDGDGIIYPHGIICNLPYMRLQGGANAVVIDPAVGDIGAAIFCSHDSSRAVATKAVAGPGSRRRFDWSDGLYIGGFLNGTPSQVIQFSAGGISITTAGTITLNGGAVAINGDLTVTGATTLTGDTAVVGDLTVSEDLTVTGEGSVGGGTQAVKLSDGTAATKLKAT